MRDFYNLFEKPKDPLAFNALRISIADPNKIREWSFGEVKKPGPYNLKEESVSVVEAISLAGGLTKLAAANRTRIVRIEGGQERAIQIDIEKIMKGDRSQDLILQAGDIVVVPEAFF